MHTHTVHMHTHTVLRTCTHVLSCAHAHTYCPVHMHTHTHTLYNAATYAHAHAHVHAHKCAYLANAAECLTSWESKGSVSKGLPIHSHHCRLEAKEQMCVCACVCVSACVCVCVCVCVKGWWCMTHLFDNYAHTGLFSFSVTHSFVNLHCSAPSISPHLTSLGTHHLPPSPCNLNSSSWLCYHIPYRVGQNRTYIL
jgi:hypothetical protein